MLTCFFMFAGVEQCSPACSRHLSSPCINRCPSLLLNAYLMGKAAEFGVQVAVEAFPLIIAVASLPSHRAYVPTLMDNISINSSGLAFPDAALLSSHSQLAEAQKSWSKLRLSGLKRHGSPNPSTCTQRLLSAPVQPKMSCSFPYLWHWRLHVARTLLQAQHTSVARLTGFSHRQYAMCRRADDF